MSSRVLIAGGGIGGLVAALSLLRHGLDVEVYEQAAELREVGAGVQIASNGSRVLCALGLQAALEAVATVPAGKEVRLYNTGQTWKLLDLGGGAVARYGAPYWMLHRGDLHRVLIDALEARRPGALHVGERCAGFEQDGDGVTLLLASGRRVRGRALIGADGVHSAIRDQMFGGLKAHFTGFVAWRGVLETADLPERLRRPYGTNWIGPKGHVVTYPLRRGELLNFVAAVERDDWQVEGWNQPGTVEECRRDFAPWHPDVLELVERIKTPFKWALLSHPALDHWSDGRVGLLGDACHPTLPFLSQGANMAIEDGMVLARCLAAQADVAAALRRYDGLRRPRATRIVDGAVDNVARFHNPVLADPEKAGDFIDREFQPARVGDRYNWLYEYDAMKVAV